MQTARARETNVELLHRLHILLRRLVDIVVGIVKLVVLEVSCGAVMVSSFSARGDINLRIGRVARI